MADWGLGPLVQAAQQPLSLQCLAAGAIGVLAHLLYFIHWILDTAAFKVTCGHVIAFSLTLVLEVRARGLAAGILSSLAVNTSYLAALFTSIAIYRIFFHRLRHFPGPFMAKFTKLDTVYSKRNNKMHEEFDSMIRQYGEFVRIGPNGILHTSLDCMTQVHGPQAKCVKANMYTALEYGPHRIHNLDGIADKTEHRYRRQVWDRAFNGKAFDAREEPVRKTVLEWLGKVDEANGQPMNWTLFASLISFDITGRVGFSLDFGGLKAGKKSILQTYIQSLFKNIAESGQVPWLISLFQRSKLPISQDAAHFEDFARKLANQRLADTEEKEDIFHYFMEDYKSEKPKSFFTKYHLECDAQAILVGAADSSFSPLTFCLRHLVLRPEVMKTLRAELATLFNKTQPGGFAHADLAHAEYLNAVIDETMRLYNPTGSNGAKRTPPEGVVLSNTFIPGNVDLVSTIWSIHRSERYFVKPLEWIPERFTTQPELVLDKRAFHPFSFGPFNCVGKRLALMTQRMVLAYTVWFCDMELAPGEDGEQVVTLSKNELFLVPGPLYLVFRKRFEGVEVEGL